MLRNTYTPTSGSGWGRNTWVILNVGYYVGTTSEIIATRFVGKISDIAIKNPIGKLPVVEITALDAINDFVNYPIFLQEILYDQTLVSGTEYLTELIPGDNWTYWNLAEPKGSIEMREGGREMGLKHLKPYVIQMKNRQSLVK